MREIEVLAEEATFSIRIDGVDKPAWGVHGGRNGGVGRAVVNPGTAEERELGMTSAGFYRDFAARVEGIKRDLLTLLRRVRADGGRVAAYGAAAKGGKARLEARRCVREPMKPVVARLLQPFKDRCRVDSQVA